MYDIFEYTSTHLNNVFCSCQIYFSITQIFNCSKWQIYFHVMCIYRINCSYVCQAKCTRCFVYRRRKLCLNVFVSCLPKGTYATIHTSGETTPQSVQQATMKTLMPIEQKHGTRMSMYVHNITYDAPLVITVQYSSPIPTNNYKTVQCQTITMLT